MSGGFAIALIVFACACAAIAAACAVQTYGVKKIRSRRRDAALGTDEKSSDSESSDVKGWALVYAQRLTRELYTGGTQPLCPSVRTKRAGSTRLAMRYKRQSKQAGCSKDVTVSAFCEASFRLSVAGGIVGALLGAVLSTELAVVLAIVFALLGRRLPLMAVSRAVHVRSLDAELHLSEMLEVVALGLRSGMTFDRSFSLYGSHFDSEFAHSCARAHRRWSLGLSSREEALNDLAASYDCAQLSRIVDSIVRSLRFGSSLAGILEEASAQSRDSYRAALEERVAKAPVKMMLPTGALILPAMLLMVMGPVLLELAGGF